MRHWFCGACTATLAVGSAGLLWIAIGSVGLAKLPPLLAFVWWGFSGLTLILCVLPHWLVDVVGFLGSAWVLFGLVVGFWHGRH